MLLDVFALSSNEFSFQDPLAFYLLPCLILLFVGEFALTRYRKKQQSSYATSRNLKKLLTPRFPLFKNTKMAGWALIWTLCCMALGGPFGNIRYPPSFAQEAEKTDAEKRAAPREIIFLVDVSASMGVPDGSDGQTRLETAKAVIEDILEGLTGQTASLYAFTSKLIPVVPPTLDYLFLRLETRDLHIDQDGVGGTRFLSVLSALRNQAFPTPSSKSYSLILLTDGGDTELESLQGNEQSQERKAILHAIPNPQKLHLRLFAIGLGSQKASPIPRVSLNGKPVLSKLEPEILQELAEKERGKYFESNGNSSWDLAHAVLEKIEETEKSEIRGQHPLSQVETPKKEDFIVDLYFQFPLGVALFFYLLNLQLPRVRRL